MIKRLSALIWKKYKYHKIRNHLKPYTKQKEEIISGLNPGKEIQESVDKYYVQKIEKVLLFVAVGFLLLIALAISRSTNRLIDDQNRIKRNDYGKSGFDTMLVAKYGEDKYEMKFTVEGIEYTPDQINDLFERCIDELAVLLKGSNSSLDHIETNLNTVSKINDYPFYIYWQTSNYDLVHEDGTIHTDNITSDGESCLITAYLTYKDYKFEHVYNLKIYPPVLDEKEIKKKEIIASVQQMQDTTQYDSYLILPSSIGMKSISWKESEDYVPVMLAALLVLSTLGIWIGLDNDLAKKYRKRNQLLSLEYSEFVSKLQLLIGSGMTLRTAFERMEADYINAKNEGGDMKYAYEELRLCLKRMHDGAGEEDSLTLFGRRCNHIAYKKLVTLLIQNSKKGTAGLLTALSNETKMAFEERKQIARRMGEEAQTKLLFPMMLMLVVVMIIIIIPAYVSFGI